jgi:hypothetical protein
MAVWLSCELDFCYAGTRLGVYDDVLLTFAFAFIVLALGVGSAFSLSSSTALDDASLCVPGSKKLVLLDNAFFDVTERPKIADCRRCAAVFGPAVMALARGVAAVERDSDAVDAIEDTLDDKLCRGLEVTDGGLGKCASLWRAGFTLIAEGGRMCVVLPPDVIEFARDVRPRDGRMVVSPALPPASA